MDFTAALQMRLKTDIVERLSLENSVNTAYGKLYWGKNWSVLKASLGRNAFHLNSIRAYVFVFYDTRLKTNQTDQILRESSFEMTLKE